MEQLRPDVAIVPCENYEETTVRDALSAALAPFGGLDWVKPDMRIAVKVNLLGAHRPEKAATTHPAIVKALCNLLAERGASVIVGDSPGGFFTRAFLAPIYAACGMHDVERPGVQLNDDYTEADVSCSAGAVLKTFRCTNYLLNADAIIDICKLKTHGLMAYTGAVKNMFGAIPGMKKSECHYAFRDTGAFSNMLVDLYEQLKPRICIADAVTVMEGNGPSVGTPRHMGALLVAENGHALDLLGAHLMSMGPADVPTLETAVSRGLVPDALEKLSVCGDYAPFVAKDFQCTPIRSIISWGTRSPVLVHALESLLADRPKVDKKRCTGCRACERHCPVPAIVMRDNHPVIERKKCIHCFCCQEFCPMGAMRKDRPPLARWLYR